MSPKAMPDKKWDIPVLLMPSCFLGGNAIVTYFITSSASMAAARVSSIPGHLLDHSIQQKPSLFYNQWSVHWLNKNSPITVLTFLFINFTRFAKHFSSKAHRSAWTQARDGADASEHSWFGEGVSECTAFNLGPTDPTVAGVWGLLQSHTHRSLLPDRMA